MIDIMLDIETLGTTPGCVILSIGAVEFDSERTGESFRVHIDAEDAVKQGLHIDARTVLWWLEQDKVAQSMVTTADTTPLADALLALTRKFNWNNRRVWCNGAAFDFPILKAAFEAVGLNTPWAYYNEMDMRTVKGLVGKEVWKRHTVVPAIAHDCLSDAISQALTLQNVFTREEIKWAA